MDNQNPPSPNPTSDPKAQIIDRVKQANNVLVTVSANPSVDQLAAAIGLTLLLNKLGKHGTAVFSGDVPPAIDFLEPEKTLEKNTDSLRDFIIALDKAKADKLRYKVEENVVKIFITPYRTSITEKDLDFSQGDFNVDVVIALGVKEQTQLDQAITAHGRILHDATVVSVNNGQGGELGSLHWEDATASSLSEMVVALGDDLSKNMLDGQIATALLTGIVAETKRFSNEKTTPKTMSISAELMAAGANQQLVATKLREAAAKPKPDNPNQPQDSGTPKPPAQPPKPRDGTLEITHDKAAAEKQDTDKPPQGGAAGDKGPDVGQIHVDDEGNLHALDLPNPPGSPAATAPNDNSRSLLTQPPSMGGTLTASSQEEVNEPSSDALSLPPVDTPFLSHKPNNGPLSPAPEPGASAGSDTDTPLTDGETLIDIEKQVDSPHVQEETAVEAESKTPPSDLDHARDAVQAAIDANPTPSDPLPPINALNAQPVFDELHETAPSQTTGPVTATMPDPAAQLPAPEQAAPSDQTPGAMNMPMPSASFPTNIAPPPNVISPTDSTNDPSAPPPVPPPIGFTPPQ